jgi:hypothetical protein
MYLLPAANFKAYCTESFSYEFTKSSRAASSLLPAAIAIISVKSPVSVVLKLSKRPLMFGANKCCVYQGEGFVYQKMYEYPWLCGFSGGPAEAALKGRGEKGGSNVPTTRPSHGSTDA